MNKYFKPALALVLVSALAVGGTLAYLTDTTDELENKFEVTNKVDIDLKETHQEFELIPGTEPTKDPTITVVKDASYVFTQVVETIPDKALVDPNTYATFVEYDINALYNTGTAGVIYRADDTTTPINWYWKLIPVTGADATTGAVEGTGYYDADAKEGDSTTYTYAYALVGDDGELLSVSSTDVMADPDNAGAFIPAEYPILEGDKVSIPSGLTQDQLSLLLTDSTDDAADATYDVLLAFQGYAIQDDGLDELAGLEEIYNAAKGE